MNNHKILLITLITFVFSSLMVFPQKGYEIKVKIPPLKDSSVILAHYFARENSFIPDDTAKLDKKGMGVFKGKKPLNGGMYIVFLPTKRYFDFILGSNNQYFSIEADTADFLKSVKFQGSPENTLFYGYIDFMNSIEKVAVKLNELKSKSVSPQQRDSITKALDDLKQEVTDYQNKVINDNPDLYFTTWLKTFQDVEVPDYPRDLNGAVLDSSFKYHYWHQHFFDNFNLTDVRLLYTPFYERKVKYYLEKVIPMMPDSINKEIDMIMEKGRTNEDVFRYLLGMMYKHYANLANTIVGMDGVFIYFAEKYYLPNATWTDDTFKENLKKEIAKIKPNLIGNVAPNIPLIEVPTDHFMVAKMDTAIKSDTHVGTLTSLQNIKARYLVLAFWEVDCGTCRKEMPLLYDSVYPAIKDKGAKILAIHMITSMEGKRKWIDFVNNHNMYDWINAVPYSYEYKDLYNAYTIPTIYILDENKKIIAKRIGVEQIEEVIEMESTKRQSTTNY